MSRRTLAGAVAFVAFLVLAVVAWTQPVPYVTFSPGPTVNVLGSFDHKQIISVTGHREYRDGGGFRLVTVVESPPDEHVTLGQMVLAWADPADAVYPRDYVYQPQDTQKSVQQQTGLEMSSSQDDATAAALTALGVKYRTIVKVADVLKGGPSDGKLEAGDVLVAVDGNPVSRYQQLTGPIQSTPAGRAVRLKIRRGSTVERVRVTPRVDAQSGGKRLIGIQVASAYNFPFTVKLDISPNIGGPSGGLMFATAIYDVLTPGSLTGGKMVAGTGTIDPSGAVGEIGGIQQKLVGAQHDGAQLFLVPAGNCAEALGGHYDPDRMRLVKVSTLTGALDAIRTWVKNPKADLPRCTS